MKKLDGVRVVRMLLLKHHQTGEKAKNLYNPPGEPQKSDRNVLGSNLAASPKSHNLRFMHCPCALSNVTRIFSGFRSR